MHKIYFDSLSFSLGDLFLKNASGRSLRAVKHMIIPRPNSEVGRNTLRYRGPVIWNFINKIAKVPESLTSFKNTIKQDAKRRFRGMLGLGSVKLAPRLIS